MKTLLICTLLGMGVSLSSMAMANNACSCDNPQNWVGSPRLAGTCNHGSVQCHIVMGQNNQISGYQLISSRFPLFATKTLSSTAPYVDAQICAAGFKNYTQFSANAPCYYSNDATWGSLQTNMTQHMQSITTKDGKYSCAAAVGVRNPTPYLMHQQPTIGQCQNALSAGTALNAQYCSQCLYDYLQQ